MHCIALLAFEIILGKLKYSNSLAQAVLDTLYLQAITLFFSTEANQSLIASSCIYLSKQYFATKIWMHFSEFIAVQASLSCPFLCFFFVT